MLGKDSPVQPTSAKNVDVTVGSFTKLLLLSKSYPYSPILTAQVDSCETASAANAMQEATTTKIAEISLSDLLICTTLNSILSPFYRHVSYELKIGSGQPVPSKQVLSESMAYNG